MFKADFKLSEQKTIKADFEIKSTGTGGTSEHNKLINRDLPDQHPISAITGLQNALSGLESSIGTETTERENADTVLSSQIDANADAILKTREDLQADIDENMGDIALLQADTTTIRSDLDDLGDQVSGIEGKIPQNASTANQLATKLDLTNAEQELRSEYMQADGELQQQINGQATAITNAQSDILSIESKIPETATSTNKLADQNFVNSSISTETATFKGTYNSVAELDNVSADNNDYAFVVSTDEAGNTVYNRYKYTNGSWVFEYALNNSSFTAQQWATINSGATQENISQITTNKNDLDDLGDEVAVIEGKIPAEATSSNQLADKNYVDTTEQEIIEDYMQADSDLQTQINGQATAITNAQDDISSIEGKIPTNASTTNLLISQSDLTSATQDIRSDFADADSDLQTQITGISSTLTTTNEKVVSIESKIPTVASDSNKLVAKSELPTLVDLAQAGEGIEFERKAHDVINDYTMTGTPDIDTNGIMTIDGTANYITSPTFENLNNNILEFEFTLPSEIGTSGVVATILYNRTTMLFGVSVTPARRIYIGGNSNRAMQTVLSLDTSYIIRYKRVGNDNIFTLLSSNKEQLEEATLTDTIETILDPFFRFGRGNLAIKLDLNKIMFGNWRARTPAFDGYEISSKVEIPELPDISSNTVNGAPLSNTSSNFFGICETSGSTAEKVVSIPSITELNAGQFIFVLPRYTASTSSNTTIKLNDFTAYPVKYGDVPLTPTTVRYVLQASYPSMFIFDGNYWVFAGQGYRYVQSYTSLTVADGIAGTASTGRLVRADYLKQIIQGTTLTDIDTTTSSTVVATDSITTAIGKLQAQITTSLGDIETALNTINSGV